MPLTRYRIAGSKKLDFGLRLSAFICASTSLAALIAHMFGVLPMVYFLTFFGVPSLLLLFALAAFGKWIDAKVFVNCLAVGVVGGTLGTVAYDVSRFVFQSSGMFDYNGFRAIYIFGSWITGQPTTTLEAGIAGWIYHYWNGISFAIFYTLLFGRRTWLIGIVYGVLMEACMLGLFPLFITITNRFDFIALSLLGHLVYGGVLGLLAQKYALNWNDTGSLE